MGTLKSYKLQIFNYFYGCNIFVETGTGKANSLLFAAKHPRFMNLYSCEIEKSLYDAVAFHSDERIKIMHAESHDFLLEICRKLKQDNKCLFWLDAHFPGADFGLKKYDEEKNFDIRLPLEKELRLVCSHRDVSRDVFLIDDLRIYEKSGYESGNVPAHLSNLMINDGFRFVEDLFEKTHYRIRDLRMEGYFCLLPKVFPKFLTEFLYFTASGGNRKFTVTA